MKLATTLACALLAAALALPEKGQAAAEPLQFVPQAKAGDSFRLRITRSREGKVGDKPATKAVAETPVTVRIVEAAPGGMLLEWTPGATRMIEPKGAPDEPLTDLAAGMRFELELESTGVLRGLRNYDEIRGKLDGLVDKASRSALNDEERQRIRQTLEQLFATRESVENALLDGARLYLMAFGRTYTEGRPESFQGAVVTPISVQPIPTSGTVKLVSVDQKTGTAKVEIRQKLDSKIAAKAVRKWVTERARKQGNPPPKEDQLGTLDIADRAEFVIPVAEGWPASVRYQRKLTTPGGSEVQVQAIRREK